MATNQLIFEKIFAVIAKDLIFILNKVFIIVKDYKLNIFNVRFVLLNILTNILKFKIRFKLKLII